MQLLAAAVNVDNWSSLQCAFIDNCILTSLYGSKKSLNVSLKIQKISPSETGQAKKASTYQTSMGQLKNQMTNCISDTYSIGTEGC